MSDNLPNGYEPSESEAYMNDNQLAYFKSRLLAWRDELLDESRRTLEKMKEGDSREIEAVEQGAREYDTFLELRTRDRYRKLIKKIDAALEKIQDGTYGYCEETGEEIGIKRLMARPIAALCIKAQEAHERREKMKESPSAVGF